MNGIKDKEKLKEAVKRIERENYFLANKILKDYEYMIFEPLELACASLAFLRKLNWITPFWNE